MEGELPNINPRCDRCKSVSPPSGVATPAHFRALQPGTDQWIEIECPLCPECRRLVFDNISALIWQQIAAIVGPPRHGRGYGGWEVQYGG